MHFRQTFSLLFFLSHKILSYIFPQTLCLSHQLKTKKEYNSFALVLSLSLSLSFTQTSLCAAPCAHNMIAIVYTHTLSLSFLSATLTPQWKFSPSRSSVAVLSSCHWSSQAEWLGNSFKRAPKLGKIFSQRLRWARNYSRANEMKLLLCRNFCLWNSWQTVIGTMTNW